MGWMEVSLTEASLIESAESKFDKDRSMEVRLTETGLTVACCIKGEKLMLPSLREVSLMETRLIERSLVDISLREISLIQVLSVIEV